MEFAGNNAYAAATRTQPMNRVAGRVALCVFRGIPASLDGEFVMAAAISRVIGISGVQSFWVAAVFAVLWTANARADLPLEYGQLSFSVPLTLPEDRPVDSISVDLDGYDISNFAALDGSSVAVNLIAPLDPGSHDITVYAFFANGDVQTVGAETLVITADTTAWNYSGPANATVEANYRVWEKETAAFEGIDESQVNGGVTYNGELSRGGWTVNANVQAIYDNNTPSNANGDEFGLPYFNVGIKNQGDWGSAGAAVGDYAVAKDGLLFENYLRRGVSVDVEASDVAGLEVFGVHSNQTTSLRRNLSYPDASDDRSFGGRFELAPLSKAHRKKLELEFGYIDGETRNGFGQVFNPDDTIRYGGDAWSLGLRSAWFADSLVFSGEYSESNFDADGLGIGEDKKRDDAYRAEIAFSSYGEFGSGIFDQWNARLRTEEVGLDYYSLGNLYIPGDLATNTGVFQASRGGFSFSTEVSRAKSNVNNDVTRPTQTTDFGTFDWYYTPFKVDTRKGLWRALGAPSLNGFFRYTGYSQPREDALKAGFDLDNETGEASLGLNFAKTSWTWGVQYTRTDFDDKTDVITSNGFVIYQPRPDSENNLFLAQLSWTPSQYLRISPLVQFNTQKEDQTNNSFRTGYLGLDFYAHLIRDKVIFNFLYTATNETSRFRSLNSDIDVSGRTTDFRLTWKAVEPRGARPGFDVYAKGNYGRQQDKILFNRNELWQLYLGVALNWAQGE